MCAQAQRLGLDTELSTGLFLLARAYHWGWGDIPRARALLQRAVSVIESSREPDIEPLLEGARCLAYLEIDMPRTAALFDELGALPALVERSGQYQWGRGLVEAWRGHLDAARARPHDGDRTGQREHRSLDDVRVHGTTRPVRAGGRRADAAAGRLCAQLGPLADKLGEGSERAYAAAVSAAHATVVGTPDGEQQLDDAIARLERIDARFLVPDLFGIVAERLYRGGLSTARHVIAPRPARAVADDVARPFEIARAHAVLACIAAAAGRRRRGPPPSPGCRRPRRPASRVTWKDCAKTPNA